MLGSVAAVSWIAFGQEPERLNNIDVTGRVENLIGIADTASEGDTSAEEIQYRPFARAGEVMETVPGLIITQHDGGGKANQYFLRGFNLDHGTDLATSLDGVPLNMPSHVHGQGYTDTNWLIPEIVKDVHFEKGPFSPEYGDFANAGNVEIENQTQLPKNILTAELGTLGYERLLAAASHKMGEGKLLYALETSHYDGAWDVPDNYRKMNGIVRFSEGDESSLAGSGYSVSAQSYYGQWVGSEQVPERAVEGGLIGRYGNLDPSDGGLTHRNSIYGEWHRRSEDSATQVNAFLVNYALNLYSDFTYFIDQTNGDQIQQTETRYMGGVDAKHTLFGQIGSSAFDNTIGAQYRQDQVSEDLNHTTARVDVSGVRSDRVKQQNLAIWYENKTSWSPHFRSVIGARVDNFIFNDASDNAGNSGAQSASAFSPKFNFIFGPFGKTEFLRLCGRRRSEHRRQRDFRECPDNGWARIAAAADHPLAWRRAWSAQLIS